MKSRILVYTGYIGCDQQMNQCEKTAKLIEFWEQRRRHYQLIDDVNGVERCNKHVDGLRNEN